ncbi:MAG: L,D-transpeptidase family protein [Sulfurimonas sp.]|nr:L,D-transpeptidase family protein [Sulfurimonas sp.]
MLNKLFALLLLSVSLNGASILTEYRQNGTKNIEKKMDLELTNTAYWYEYLKNIDTSFGYLESYKSILTCNKENSTLALYQYNQDKKFTQTQNYSAFTGEKSGDKTKEGDLKTPLGIYTITQKISKLDSFYGPLALVSSYPNLYDNFRGKTGSGIWIHGLPTEQERDDYTKGCIAINNDNMLCLDKEIDIESTLLIINPQNKLDEVSKKVLSQILSGLYAWRYSWLYNDTAKYLSFYSSNFLRHDGMKYENFVTYKTRIFNKKRKKTNTFYKYQCNTLPKYI